MSSHAYSSFLTYGTSSRPSDRLLENRYEAVLAGVQKYIFCFILSIAHHLQIRRSEDLIPGYDHPYGFLPVARRSESLHPNVTPHQFVSTFYSSFSRFPACIGRLFYNYILFQAMIANQHDKLSGTDKVLCLKGWRFRFGSSCPRHLSLDVVISFTRKAGRLKLLELFSGPDAIR